MTKINPFKPNSPVSPGMFAGRLGEIEDFESGLAQTRSGNPINYLVTGERGIGKSSLLSVFNYLANGSITAGDSDTFNFLTINAVVSERTNLKTLITLINNHIRREAGKIETVRSFLDKTWEFVQRIKIMDSGIETKGSIENSDLVMDEFAYSLSETCKRLCDPEKGEVAKDGIVFLIDETDNAGTHLHLGYFIKVVTELLQKNGCAKVMFVFAGLPSVIEKLSDSHESSLRVFNHLNVEKLGVQDCYYVIEKGINEGNEINNIETQITDNAKKHIKNLSEGYPHFIQQFSYSAFKHDTDDNIDKDDVLNSAFTKGGALNEIGSRYYLTQYLGQIQSDEYREVLNIMADKWNSWVKKSEIRENFSGSDSTLTSALSALTERKIILKNKAKRGEYRLPQTGFALWIKLFAEVSKT